jgi:TPP-dependent pyruvate/acetoin dehydrogenase alpha subunit
MGLHDEALGKMQEEAAQEADSAFEFARNSPMPMPAAALTDVFQEDPS